MALRWQICLLCSQESPNDLVSLSSMVSQRSSASQSFAAALQKRCNTAGFTLFSRVVCQPNRNVTGKNLVDFFPFLEVRRSESESASTFRSNLQRMEGGVGSLRNHGLCGWVFCHQLLDSEINPLVAQSWDKDSQLKLRLSNIIQ